MHSYTQLQLHGIAKDNYNVLRSYCAVLEKEGYWDGPGKLLRMSIGMMLDMYVQTVLVSFIMFCGKASLHDLSFIASIPENNVYDIVPENGLDKRVKEQTKRLFDSPPILMQLCGLRDKTVGSGMLGMFFEGMLNIQLSMAFFDSEKTGTVASFIHDYYRKIEMFMGSGESYSSIVDERYIFRKLCNDSLEKSAEELRECGDDFSLYKEKHFGLTIKQQVAAVSSPSASKSSESINETKAEVIVEEPADKKASRLDELLNELNSLVGLENVKSEVNSLINLIKVRSIRKKRGLPMMDMSFHMVFSGNPGTGKTTVARLISEIYKELGLLSKGTLVETDRSGLVAGYVGQTAIKVHEVVEKALGGVLFIDEAYSLASDTSNDFGDEAIETLVKMMEDHRDDLVVIVAGYTDEMQHFLKSNTGLMSRFNKFITFDDYSNTELIEILKRMAERSGYTITDEALQITANKLDSMDSRQKTLFGNARGIRNMFERIVINQANRIAGPDEPDEKMLCELTGEDVAGT